jgi:DNA-binding beta-propeller fold protein YncE
VLRWSLFIAISFVVALASAWAPAAVRAGGYEVAAVWGETGTALGQLRTPKGVAVARDGSVFVVDYANHTLVKYSAAGRLLGAWGGKGSAPGRFHRCSRVAIGPSGDVYVTDAENHRIQRFSQSGEFLGQWGGHGAAPGKFDLPRGIDVARDGSVYVTDQGNRRVQVFTAKGRFLRQWDGGGRFGMAKDIAVADSGKVYVVDSWTNRVHVFTGAGRWLGGFGGRGSAWGRLLGPRGLALGAGGHVFVADAMNYRIQEFSGAGEFVRAWGCKGRLVGLFQAPRDLAEAPDGSLVVVDSFNHRLLRYVKDGSDDDTAPVTRCARSSGWAAEPLDLVLAASDAGSGVAATYASVDGDRFHLADAPVHLGRQGAHEVRFLSVDDAGNQEVTRLRVFRLDWTAPVVRFGTRGPLRATARGVVSVRCELVDVLSRSLGVRVRLESDGETVGSRDLGGVRVSRAGRTLLVRIAAPRDPGAYRLTVAARDRAGNLTERALTVLVRAR